MKLAEVTALKNSIQFLSVKDLDVEEIKKTLQLKKCVTNTVKDTDELQKQIMKKFDVKEVGHGTFEYTDHPQKDDIQKDIDEVNNANYPIEPLNFLDTKKIKLSGIDSIGILEILVDNLGK